MCAWLDGFAGRRREEGSLAETPWKSLPGPPSLPFHSPPPYPGSSSGLILTGLENLQQAAPHSAIKGLAPSVQSCPTLCNPMNRSTSGLPVHHQLLKFTQLTSIESVMPSSHLILCHPLLLLPSIPPSIRVFSNESTLRMRWPKY